MAKGRENRRLLLIDDQATMFATSLKGLKRCGYDLAYVEHEEEVLSKVKDYRPQVILLDLRFPGDENRDESTGSRLLKEIKNNHPHTPIVIFTTTLTDDSIKVEDLAGAQFKYAKSQLSTLTKEGKDAMADLARVLDDAILATRRKSLVASEDLGFVTGDSEAMRSVVEQVVSAARTTLPVLLLGEAGTEVEAIGRAIHKLSARKGQFIPISCASSDQSELERTLFGFTAKGTKGKEQRGAIESAHHGTIFLMDVHALPSNLQDKLHRVLKEGHVQRLGDLTPVKVDARVIAATDRDLTILVQQNILRQTFVYAIKSIRIRVPPLRERLEDISHIASSYIKTYGQDYGKEMSDYLRADVVDILKHHSWPGNVAELESVLTRAIVTSSSNVLLPQDIQIDTDLARRVANDSSTDEERPALAGAEVMDESELVLQIAKSIIAAPPMTRHSALTKYKPPRRGAIAVEIVKHVYQQDACKVTWKGLQKFLDAPSEVNLRRMLISDGVRLSELPFNR